ncbi:MAG: hypothetical protein ACLUHK_04710 [Eubacteriales bacterium]
MENTSGLEKFKQIIFSKKNKDRAFIFLMLLLPVAQFAVFYVYVNVDSILMAFQIKEGDAFYWGIDNFKTLFEEFGRSDSIISGAFRNFTAAREYRNRIAYIYSLFAIRSGYFWRNFGKDR